MPKRRKKADQMSDDLYVDLRRVGRSPLPCDFCDAEVTKEPGGGWVMWWAMHEGDPLRYVVVDFSVGCKACSCKAEDRRTDDGAMSFDGPLDWFAGRWAIVQLRQLLTDYEWGGRESKPLQRLLEFAVRASTLPTGKGPPQMG